MHKNLTSVPTVEAPLNILMRVAKSTASTPGGHKRAAKTSVGIKAICPKMAMATSSPKTKAPSGIPRSRLKCVIRNKFDKPKGTAAMDDQNKISLIGTYTKTEARKPDSISKAQIHKAAQTDMNGRCMSHGCPNNKMFFASQAYGFI
jgi:hypothetical protein